jgi:hypothetical protein
MSQLTDGEYDRVRKEEERKRMREVVARQSERCLFMQTNSSPTHLPASQLGNSGCSLFVDFPVSIYSKNDLVKTAHNEPALN